MKKLFLLFTLLVSFNSIGQTAEEYFKTGYEFYQKRECLDAISNLNIAININPKYAEAYNIRGYAKEFLGDTYGAISDYSKAIDFEVHDIKKSIYYASRGSSKSKLNDLRGAFSDYSKSIDIAPHWGIYSNRGSIQERLGDFIGALSDYTKCLEINPDDWVTWRDRGLLKIKMGEKESGCLDLSRMGELGYSNAYELIREYCN
jgi:tetratricopeptide (TPR) repeat protein